MNAEKLWSLNEKESTGTELDVVGQDKQTGEYIVLIVLRKLPKATSVFVLTEKGWSRGRNLDQNHRHGYPGRCSPPSPQPLANSSAPSGHVRFRLRQTPARQGYHPFRGFT